MNLLEAVRNGKGMSFSLRIGIVEEIELSKRSVDAWMQMPVFYRA
jgi:hypothetical protein